MDIMGALGLFLRPGMILLLTALAFQVPVRTKAETLNSSFTSPTMSSDSSPSGPYRRVTLCPPSLCYVDLFRRTCFYSKEPLCPPVNNPKATICCPAGCCAPQSTTTGLKDFFRNFWVVAAIIGGILFTSAVSYWFRRGPRSRLFRSNPHRPMNREASNGTTVEVVLTTGHTCCPSSQQQHSVTTCCGPIDPNHPPGYDIALTLPKPDEYALQVNNGGDDLDNLPAYDELSVRNMPPMERSDTGISQVPTSASTHASDSGSVSVITASGAFPVQEAQESETSA